MIRVCFSPRYHTVVPTDQMMAMSYCDNNNKSNNNNNNNNSNSNNSNNNNNNNNDDDNLRALSAGILVSGLERLRPRKAR